MRPPGRYLASTPRGSTTPGSGERADVHVSPADGAQNMGDDGQPESPPLAGQDRDASRPSARLTATLKSGVIRHRSMRQPQGHKVA